MESRCREGTQDQRNLAENRENSRSGLKHAGEHTETSPSRLSVPVSPPMSLNKKRIGELEQMNQNWRLWLPGQFET